MLNLVVPLLTLFGVLNLVVSSEAIEGFFNFFQDPTPGMSRNYVGSDGIIIHGNAAVSKEETPIDPSKLQPVVQELYHAQQNYQNINTENSYQQELQVQQQVEQQLNFPQNGRMPIGSGNAADILNSMSERNLLDPSPIKMSQFREIGADPENDLEETNVNQDNDFRPGLDFNNMQFPDSSKIHVTKCPNLDGHDWSEEITPKYTSHPWRFLMPILYYGPNNQIHGLRESIILAIKLNRTLALPPFHKHASLVEENTPYSDLVEPTHRIDERALRHLVKIVKLDELRQKCGTWFGTALLTRPVSCQQNMFERLFSFEYYTQIHILKYHTWDDFKKNQGANCELLHSPPLPPLSAMADKRAIQLPNSDEELKKLYFSNERCAALVFPFKNFNFDPIVLKAQSDRLTPDMRSLMEDVINATPRPPYIKDVATMFIDEIIRQGDFIGIHWRYDLDDWMSINCKDGVQGFMGEKCSQIHSARADPTILARGVAKIVQYLGEKGATRSKIVYIATPLAEEDMIERINDWLEQNTSIKVLWSRHLQTFFDHFYQNCDVVNRDWLDLLSLLEQEVVYRSTVFIRSVVSSWSLNVQLQRSVENRDKFDVTNWRLLGT
ncbi:unnamed protein product [Oikopleura dioica]|uniref:GDP-fucose protein O-fucosyltransferase 2 n=2 Tax=Oikopleura dioica TaxID=34765 RepID=E4X1J8_OIKDI|nr:unnamed protein product [Oikopleura dioica]